MNQIHSLKEYILATIILSLIHGSIPNHWLPFVAISRTEKWSFKTLFYVISFGAFFHSLSTALLGFFISYLGYHISTIHQLEKILPTFFMILLGMIYIILNHHNDDHKIQYSSTNKLYLNLFFLYSGMFFSPCLEIEAVYFAIGKYGFFAFILISLIYMIITLLSMQFFTYLGFKSLVKYYPKFLEEQEKKIVGIILILLGIFSYFY
jgi:hypothetical protein